MKVAFLDFDGVFTATHRCWLAGNEYDSYSAKIISKVLTDYDYKIVVSSTWRILHDDYELSKFLKIMGFSSKLFFMKNFSTPRLPGIRGVEIKDWLDRHPEVEDYIIIDDDSDMLPEQMDHLILCDGREGFGARNYFQVCRRHDPKYEGYLYDFNSRCNEVLNVESDRSI